MRLKKILNTLLFLVAFPALGDVSFEEIKIEKSRTPTEFRLLVDHLRLNSLSHHQAKALVNGLTSIDKNLIKTKDEEVVFYLKSETYKALISNPYTHKKSYKSLTDSHYLILQSKLKVFKKSSPFGHMILDLMINDLKPYYDKKMLNTESRKKLPISSKLKLEKLENTIMDGWLPLIK